MRTLLIIFASAYTAIGQTIKCPAAYHTVGTGCYTFPEISCSWLEASTFCQFSGGYLVVIDSDTEYVALTMYHYKYLTDTPHFWIGATDMISEGAWHWVSGETVDYNIWGPGEPEYSLTDNCAYWTPGNDTWRNIDCWTVYDDFKPLCEAHPL